jgi:putative membrane protein
VNEHSDVRETVDATRRTRLANERTFLAWWRTGLTAFAVGLAAGGLVPELTGGERWPYVLDGVGFAVLGIVLLVYGFVRQRSVDRALATGAFAPPDVRVVAALTILGSALGVLTLLLLVIAP